MGDVVTHVLTPFGIFIQFLIALKKGACPIVDFLDDENIQVINKISKESEGKTDLLKADSHYYSDFLWDILGYYVDSNGHLQKVESQEDPMKDQIFKDIFGQKNRPVRLKVMVGRYIIGQITLKMLLESLRVDIVELNKPEKPPANVPIK